MGMNTTTKLPTHLHHVYEWTDAAGEIDQLRALTGEALFVYCAESAANAADGGDEEFERTVESELLELHAWLAS